MNTLTSDTYKDWTIVVTSENNMCSNFSFDIISPDGYSQHVSMGGDNVQRAMERAKEMIDMELDMVDET